MKISKNGLNVLKQFESCRLKAYKCVPTEQLYTIGFGHYGVKKGASITKEQAIKLLQTDLEKFESKVNRYNGIYNFNQNQFDALVSFAYNVGSIEQLTDNGTRSIDEIADSFHKYVYSGGKKLKGLVNRRTAEHKLFVTPINKTITDIALEVISGEWGTGEERKKRLTKAGYEYCWIQAEINRILK